MAGGQRRARLRNWRGQQWGRNQESEPLRQQPPGEYGQRARGSPLQRSPTRPLLEECGSTADLYPTHGDSVSRAPPKYSNQVERNEERCTKRHAAPGLRGGGHACLQIRVKINNYLNIWRIAVSSDAMLPCPLKPAEMQIRAKRDAASLAKVNENWLRRNFSGGKTAPKNGSELRPRQARSQGSNDQPAYLPPTKLRPGWQLDCFKSSFLFVSASSSPRRRNLPSTHLGSSGQAFTESVPSRFLLLQAAEN